MHFNLSYCKNKQQVSIYRDTIVNCYLEIVLTSFKCTLQIIRVSNDCLEPKLPKHVKLIHLCWKTNHQVNTSLTFVCQSYFGNMVISKSHRVFFVVSAAYRLTWIIHARATDGKFGVCVLHWLPYLYGFKIVSLFLTLLRIS